VGEEEVSKKLRINTREGLEQFLSIIAEESVARARVVSEDERMKQADMAGDLSRLKQRQSPGLKSEEDDDLFAKKPEKKKSTDKEAEPKEEKPEPEKKPELEKPAASGPDRITFTMIKDKVNTIRSGRSLRDDEIRGELKDYFNELTGDEQEALFAFLDGISQVLTAGIEGEEATEPSKDPYNLKVTSSDDTKKSKPKEQPKKSPAKKPQPSGKKDLEDTSPPIDVGKKQRTEALRRHIRELMG
jgi:hypothetical protein